MTSSPGPVSQTEMQGIDLEKIEGRSPGEQALEAATLSVQETLDRKYIKHWLVGALFLLKLKARTICKRSHTPKGNAEQVRCLEIPRNEAGKTCLKGRTTIIS